MKKAHNTAQKRSLRRWVRQVFASFIKLQHHNYLKEILQKLRDLDESIDIIAREMARQGKRSR